MDKHNSFKIGVFADKYVGLEAIKFLLTNHKKHLTCVCVVDRNSDIVLYLRENAFPPSRIYFWSDMQSKIVQDEVKAFNLNFILLAWWPYIVKKDILRLPINGILNFHPSLLPCARGKNYNFWTIVEEVPFGVTIHFVNEEIDSGDILFQKEIAVLWEDTGKTLYEKAQIEMIDLFKHNYCALVEGNYIRRKQDLKQGSFHLGIEMEKKAELNLKSTLLVRELLNLLRAKTFKPYPGCYFFDGGRKYEVRIRINEIKETDKINNSREVLEEEWKKEIQD